MLSLLPTKNRLWLSKIVVFIALIGRATTESDNADMQVRGSAIEFLAHKNSVEFPIK